MTESNEMSLGNEVDEDLQKRVQLYLLAKHPELGKLQVSANEGMVRLHGPVSSFHIRQLALSVTSRVAGVHHVVDEMDVPLPHRKSPKRKPH